MGERTDAVKLAHRILDRPHADPDNDLALLSRQLLRSVEIIGEMNKQLQAVDWDGQAQLDLIHANRDEILKKHEEAISLIRKVTAKYVKHGYTDGMGAVDTRLLWDIIKALSLFHPMHGESWKGWPEGS